MARRVARLGPMGSGRRYSVAHGRAPPGAILRSQTSSEVLGLGLVDGRGLPELRLVWLASEAQLIWLPSPKSKPARRGSAAKVKLQRGFFLRCHCQGKKPATELQPGV